MIIYLVSVFVIAFFLFLTAGTVLHTNTPLTDFLLSFLVAHLIYGKCESYLNVDGKTGGKQTDQTREK